MKKSFLVFVLISPFLSYVATSQSLIVVQNGGNPSFFQQFDDAILNSHDGDTIYLPGGTWNVNFNQPINKCLHIIGVGYNPDSTKSTYATSLIGSINLTKAASMGSITGVFLSGGLFIGSDSISSYTIMRCYLSNALVTPSTFINNFTLIQNIILGDLYNNSTKKATNCSFFNNIISSGFSTPPWNLFSNSVFKNNIFMYSANTDNTKLPISGQYLLMENNIIFDSHGFQGVSNSISNNNLFIEQIVFPIGTNLGSNNIVNQAQSSIFINQTGTSFSYSHDYQLQPSSSGKNSGTDGSDIGIYGGLYPWKDGSLPANPHIQFKKIAGNTDKNGNLQINIKVQAQDR